MLAADMSPRTVMDIGCGNKGVIAQAYWQERNVQKGYAVDRHVVKELPRPWTPLVMDAEDLLVAVQPNTIDFLTHCGLLEHIPYAKALRILNVLERITVGTCFFTCSALLREVDYKVKIDGNPFHFYKSWWDAKTFELLGYEVDRERMKRRLTFCQEVTGWFSKNFLPKPRSHYFARAQQHLVERACYRCELEPFKWDSAQDRFVCLNHSTPNEQDEDAIVQRWKARNGEGFNCPPWRKPRPIL